MVKFTNQNIQKIKILGLSFNSRTLESGKTISFLIEMCTFGLHLKRYITICKLSFWTSPEIAGGYEYSSSDKSDRLECNPCGILKKEVVERSSHRSSDRNMLPTDGHPFTRANILIPFKNLLKQEYLYNKNMLLL